MTLTASVEDSGRQQRRRQLLDDEPPAVSPEAGRDREHFSALGDDEERSRSDRNSAEEDSADDERASGVFDAAFRWRHDIVSPTESVVDRLRCERRKRSPADTGRRAAELFPVPVVTSSSPTAVTCRPRASSSSSVGVGRTMLMWLPWLLPMTSLGLAAALPVHGDASRSPVKVFDGSVDNADVDAPVIGQRCLIFMVCPPMLVAWSSGRSLVFGRCAFAVLRSTCS